MRSSLQSKYCQRHASLGSRPALIALLHEDPVWKVKIVLIAALPPLHHRLEHKVVHYLCSRQPIIPSGRKIWQVFRLKNKQHGEHRLEKEGLHG